MYGAHAEHGLRLMTRESENCRLSSCCQASGGSVPRPWPSQVQQADRSAPKANQSIPKPAYKSLHAHLQDIVVAWIFDSIRKIPESGSWQATHHQRPQLRIPGSSFRKPGARCPQSARASAPVFHCKWGTNYGLRKRGANCNQQPFKHSQKGCGMFVPLCLVHCMQRQPPRSERLHFDRRARVPYLTTCSRFGSCKF